MSSKKATQAQLSETRTAIVNSFSVDGEQGVVPELYLARLMQLGFSGTVETQRLFVNVFQELISVPKFRDMLFTTAKGGQSHGPELLSKLLWCADFDDVEISEGAQKNILKLTNKIEGNINMNHLFI